MFLDISFGPYNVIGTASISNFEHDVMKKWFRLFLYMNPPGFTGLESTMHDTSGEITIYGAIGHFLR